jgi:hypothetical protein
VLDKPINTDSVCNTWSLLPAARQKRFCIDNHHVKRQLNNWHEVCFIVCIIIFPMGSPMKSLMSKLEALFLSMTLVDGCTFKRGLQVRYRPVRPMNAKMHG